MPKKIRTVPQSGKFICLVILPLLMAGLTFPATKTMAQISPTPRIITVGPENADDLTKAIEHLTPGDTLKLRPGLYRAEIDLRESPHLKQTGHIKIEAEKPGVVIKGSDIVKDWKSLGDGRWDKQPWPVEPEQVFINDQPLQQIGGNVFDGYPGDPTNELHALHRSEGGIWPGRTGNSENDLRLNSFYYDAPAKRLVIEIDPNIAAGFVAEASVRTYLFFSDGLPFVELSGINFIHSNTTRESRTGAITILGDNAKITGNTVVHCDGVGIVLNGQDGLVNNNKVEACGQLGMKVVGSRHEITNNVLSGNNTRLFNKWWEAGGAKFVGDGGINDSIISGNRALFNFGDGLWFDWGNKNNIVEDNICAYNQGFGLQYEAGGPAKIRGNYAVANMLRGIYVLHSKAIVTEHNIAAFNDMEGIVVMDEGLRDQTLDLETSDNIVRNNIIAYNVGTSIVLPAEVRNNHSLANLFIEPLADSSTFLRGWTTETNLPVKGLAAWQAKSGEEQGSLTAVMPVPDRLSQSIVKRHDLTDWNIMADIFQASIPGGKAFGPRVSSEQINR